MPKAAIAGGERTRGQGGLSNNRGIIYPVMALTTTQRLPGRDHIRHTHTHTHSGFRTHSAGPRQDA